MYGTILVPLDGSKRAEAILPHAQDLAERHGATVILLRVVEPVPIRVGPEGAYSLLPEDLEGWAKQAQSYLSVLQDQYREKGIEVQTRVVYGSPVEAITEAAKSEGADLIAMAN